MKIHPLEIADCFLLENDVFNDKRGFFREWYKSSSIKELDLKFEIAQANFSISGPGVIRGLHYSLSPIGQHKIVTCVQGSILDYLVDIRLGSPTYLKKKSIILAASSGLSILIASGVAHGFSVPKETAGVSYLTSSEYSFTYEKSINPFDIELNIDWNLIEGTRKITSDSDLNSPSYSQAKLDGKLPTYKGYFKNE